MKLKIALVIIFSLTISTSLSSLYSKDKDTKKTSTKESPKANITSNTNINEFKVPEWWNNGVFYQIFVRSFYDSDNDGKGDLKGITKKLDYLQDLGITGIWLCPIFGAFSYHGYDTTNYYVIDKAYGTMQDFEELVNEAHKRNIKIILDLVINHTSKRHPWFIDSVTNENSPYKDWYIWSDTDKPGWINASGARQPAWNSMLDNIENNTNYYRYGKYYYAAFNGTIPDLNFENPEVIEEVKKIAKFWLEKGVDGFRLDGARFIFEDGPGNGQADSPRTVKFWDEFSKYCRTIKPDAYLIAEIFAGLDKKKLYYTGDNGLSAVFNFEFVSAINSSLAVGKLSQFKITLAGLLETLKSKIPMNFLSIFISNHDVGRFAELVRTIEKIKIAAVLQFTLPGGTPYIYYGDEIGEREGDKKIGDAWKRNPMWWNSGKNAGFTEAGGTWCGLMKTDIQFYTNKINVEDQINDPQSTFNLYKKLIKLRKANSSLQKGEFYEINFDSETDRNLASVFGFLRKYENNMTLVLFNAGKNQVSIDQSLDFDFIKQNLTKFKYIDGIYSKDQSINIPNDIITPIFNNGKLNLNLDGREFIMIIFENI